MLRCTRTSRIGVVSTTLANAVLWGGYTLHIAGSPFAVLLFGGVLLRVATLPLSLYGDKCLARLAHATPELVAVHTRCDVVMQHPRATSWDRQVAQEQLQHERAEVLRAYKTSNVRATLPQFVAAVLSFCVVYAPAAQLAEFFCSPATTTTLLSATHAAGTSVAVYAHLAGPLAFALTRHTLVLVNMTPAVACALTLYNVLQCLSRRRGFRARSDKAIQLSAQLAPVIAAGVACYTTWLLSFSSSSSLCACTATSAMLLAAAPMWLGVALTSTVATVLVHHTSRGRALAGVAAYPRTHGAQAPIDTTTYHPLRSMFSPAEMAVQKVQWQKVKRLLDYECSVRLHSLLRRVSVYDDVGEAEYELARNRERQGVAHARHNETATAAAEEEQHEKDTAAAADAVADASAPLQHTQHN